MKSLARIGLASAVVILLGGTTEARARAASVAVGGELRTGDWLVVEPVTFVPIGESEEGSNLAATARGVLGVGGSGAALGLALLGRRCVAPRPCALRNSELSSIVGVDARIERMYGPSSWRHTVYEGAQLFFGGSLTKWSVGWMFDVHDVGDNHLQIGFGGGF